MFVDFDKVFSKTPQTELKIPEALAEQLSSKLPEGLRYVIDKKTNNLVITHDNTNNKKITINGMILAPTEEQLEILGEGYKFDDIMKLSYNSQKPIPVKFSNGQYVNINGEEISINHFVYNPFNPHEVLLDSTCMFPPPFPSTFSLSIGCEKISMELTINRIPNNSVNVMAFESDKDRCLTIKYYFDPTTDNFSINITLMPQNAGTVKEIIDSIEIYNAFINGKGIISGVTLEKKIDTKEGRRYDSDALEFWKRVYELEKKMGAAFAPPFIDMDFEDICDIEEVYQNIINKKPIRKNTNINSITSKWEFTKDEIARDNLGKPVYFEFDGTSCVELFGQKIEFPCLIGIFNAIISKYEKRENDGECTLFLESESDEKQMYVSTLRFLTEEELIEYKQKTENRIILFRDAKKCHEYLIKQ